MDELITKLAETGFSQAPGIVGMLVMLIAGIKAMQRMMVGFQDMLTAQNERSESTIKSLANAGNQTARQYSKDQVAIVQVVTENKEAMKTTTAALLQVDKTIAKLDG